MKRLTQTLALAATLPAALSPVAQSRAELPAVIVSICEADTANAVIVPEGMLERLMTVDADADADADKQKPRSGMAGYRVQVFSDNNSRTAKNEARVKEQTVMTRFPQYRTYKKYSAPYWRLRVGDFRSQEAAEAAAAEMRRAFPSFAKEIRVVRDRINATD